VKRGDFLRESIKARRQCTDVLKKLKGKKCQPKIYRSSKNSLQRQNKDIFGQKKTLKNALPADQNGGMEI